MLVLFANVWPGSCMWHGCLHLACFFVLIKALRTFGFACLHLATVLSTLGFVALHLAWVFFICRWRIVYVWLGWLTCG